jgi:glycosyltransferase involved in cell wall biosynthesis
MLKVLTVVDKTGTALDRLAKGVAPYHTNLDYHVVAVHPKRPDASQLEAFENAARDADVIDWQYFRTAEMLRARYDWLASKPQILTHNNPYSITESDWNNYDAVVANNLSMQKALSTITNAPLSYIPLTVDADFWEFNQDWQPNNNVIMVANRIESKKGILPVAIACADAGLHFILVGAVSDAEYMAAIMATGNVEFHEQITDDELKALYYKSTIHVCNSFDNFESGTMPILEAMLTGVPVLTREVGHVPDLYNGENMQLLKYEPENPNAIADELRQMIYDKKKLYDMRDRAWQSAKVRNFERRAYAYQKLYRQVLFPDQQSVSVIVPVYDKPEVIRQNLNAIASQTYQNIEIVVADDNFAEPNYDLIEDFAQYVNFPVRYLRTSLDAVNDYGLARARNEAVIEATGEILVFADQRIVMDKDAVEVFVANLNRGKWLHGTKGAKKEFVENFSCAYRADVIKAGMFNERINLYGGQSQEIRERIRAQGMMTEFVEGAKAKAVGKSSNRNRQRNNIIKMKNRLAKMHEL